MMDAAKVSYHSVQAIEVGQRLDNFLMGRFRSVPRSKIYSIIRTGQVRVNKKRAKPLYAIQMNDAIRIPPLVMHVQHKPAPNPAMIAQVLRAIIYEDQHYLLLNKPSGLPVHSGSGHPYGLIELLRLGRPKHQYYELVHRIDEATTGCVIVVKCKQLLRLMHQLLQQKTMHKRYVLIAQKTCRVPDSSYCDQPLLKKTHGRDSWMAISPEGKPSLTKFKCVHQGPTLAYLEAKPVTGRTHQIRVHAAFLGWPILGDQKYNRLQSPDNYQGTAMMLHAMQVSFRCPLTKQKRFFSAPIPQEMNQWLDTLKKPTA
jgi:23S rRNA pseudouridine955/2504/2580 synthase